MQKTFNSDNFMKMAGGFYQMGCNKFTVNGLPNMTSLENKNLFGRDGFNFREMDIDQIQKKFAKFK